MLNRKERYEAYITSRAWAQKKRQFWATTSRSCIRCKGSDLLHVHHHTYVRLGNEELSDLVALCEGCHSLVHLFQRRSRWALTRATFAVIATPHGLPSLAQTNPHQMANMPQQGKSTAKSSRKLTSEEKKALSIRLQENLIKPNDQGFVPRHLRGASTVNGNLIAGPGGGWSRATWRS